MKNKYKILISTLLFFCFFCRLNASTHFPYKILNDTFYIKYDKKHIIEKDQNRIDKYVQFFFKSDGSKVIKPSFIMDGIKDYQLFKIDDNLVYLNESKIVNRYKNEGNNFLNENIFFLFKKKGKNLDEIKD